MKHLKYTCDLCGCDAPKSSLTDQARFRAYMYDGSTVISEAHYCEECMGILRDMGGRFGDQGMPGVALSAAKARHVSSETAVGEGSHLCAKCGKDEYSHIPGVTVCGVSIRP